MPAYDYKCLECELTQEVSHGWYDKPTVPCTYCNEPMIKGFSASAVHFKGKGWGKDV